MNSLEADAIKQYMSMLSVTCADIKDSLKKVHGHLQVLDDKVNRLEFATNDIRRVLTGAAAPTSSSNADEVINLTNVPQLPPSLTGPRFPMDLLTAKKLDAPSFYVRYYLCFMLHDV